jgi:hypothetical protein
MNGELITHFESFPNSTTTLYDEHLSRSFCHGYPLRSLHPSNQIQNFLPLSITKKKGSRTTTQNLPAIADTKYAQKMAQESALSVLGRSSSDGVQRRARRSTPSARAPLQVWMKMTIVGMILWMKHGNIGCRTAVSRQYGTHSIKGK